MEKRKEFPDRPWTIEEVAEYLQVSERTIHARIKDSGLPFVRIGGMIRFLRADIDRWLAQQAAECDAPTPSPAA